jgi:Predicted EndoIII-related endonuclease
MQRAERATKIMGILNKIYPKTPIPLNHKNKFELLISVLLSAQCTDKRVNKITPILFKEANNAKKMQMLSKNTIYKIIRPCGLAPQKSIAIHRLSKILVNNFNGKVPESFDELEKLPGVGHKTASVVMSQGFGHQLFLLTLTFIE